MEGRSLSEVAHLAELGVNTVRAGILGLQTIRSSEFTRCFVFIEDSDLCAGRADYRFICVISVK